MKNPAFALSILIFTMYSVAIRAQANLEFSAIKTLELSGINNAAGQPTVIDSFDIVVPAGKAWKVESVSVGRQVSLSGVITSADIYLTLNGVLLTENTSSLSVTYPIWLAQGTYKLKLYSSPLVGKGMLSAIEFTLTP